MTAKCNLSPLTPNSETPNPHPRFLWSSLKDARTPHLSGP